MFDFEKLISDRAHDIDASGIRRVFDLAQSIKNPINLSIGQPHFKVPDNIKQATINAINNDKNGYTVTQGIPELRKLINREIDAQFKQRELWNDYSTLITSGVSGSLLLALLTCVQPGDEVIIPDPYFVMYKHLITLVGGTAVPVDTYPDFKLTAELVKPHITDKTKLIINSTPSNPTGVVLSPDECKALAKLAEQHNILLISDEIYDTFCYETVDTPIGPRCPSPANHSDNVLVLRGFSKTYAITGWRLAYAVGPTPIIQQMTKLQQYTFVCAPSIAQHGCVAAYDTDMSQIVTDYKAKRDKALDQLSANFEITTPGGAFYIFPKVPNAETATQFVERAIANDLLIIPGGVFSDKDTHFRISYATDDQTLDKGLKILNDLAKG